MKPKLKFKFLLYLGIALLATWLISTNIQKPFIGHHDWNAAFYGNIARNYLRFGYLKTKLGQVTNTGIATPDQFNYYTHYPPLFPLTVSLSYRLFNVSEFSTRLVPVVFTVGFLLLLFHLSTKLKFSITSSLAATAVMFTPMVRYYGTMPTQESMMILFSLLSVIFYLNLVKRPNQKNFYKLLLITFLNGLTGWAGYFLYPLLFLHSLIYFPKAKRLVALSFGVLLLTFSLHLAHTFLLTGSLTGGGLITVLLLRLNLSDSLGFTLKKYLVQQARWLTIYYTRILLVSALFFLLAQAIKLAKKIKLESRESMILLLFLFGLSYPVIFSNVVFIHEYFNTFFLPFMALSFVWLVNQISQFKARLAVIVALVLTALIATERLEFIKALNQTQAHQPGYELGTLINQTVPESQIATVVADEKFIDTQQLFINFYANRQVKFINSETDLSQDSDYTFYND